MKKVVLFKSVSEEYERAFREHDFEAIFVEPLQFTFMNLERLADKLQGEYSALVLTSPRAIDAVARCWGPAKFVAWNARRVYTVGDASCHRIKVQLGLDALGAASGSAENLAKLILKENDDTSTFLFPCGNLRSETLPSALQSKGIMVDSLTVYETKENENLKSDLMELNESTHNPCCMVFFSPSGCEYIHRQLQTFSNRLTYLPYFAIGNSTAHKIENLGVEIAGVAEKPCADSVIQSVQRYFAASSCSEHLQ